MKQTAASVTGISGLRVLVVDDEADIRQGLRKLISGLGATVSVAADGSEALDAVAREGADLVLTDLMMPKMSGAELLVAVKESYPQTVVVVLTGYGTIQGAVSCLQNGAAHFLTKPFDNQEMLNLVSRLGRQVLATRDSSRTSNGKAGIVAEDPAMVSVMRLVDRLATSPVPVLIEGESGTGKEVIARAIHERSTLSKKPFLAVNAAALPDTLLESELFGHRRGAFTGADRDREGIFREVRGGHVFLDELPSMSPSFQGKLLRVLEDKRVRPVGGGGEVPVDFRLLCATNRDLEALVRAGEFREDLFYRVGVLRLRLPPLRERPGDVMPLALRFLKHAAATCLAGGAAPPELGLDAIEALQCHHWPGNVRELENAIYRALVSCSGERILPHHLGLDTNHWSADDAGKPVAYAEGKRRAIESFQRELVQRTLERTRGNVSRAAERCGLTRAALQRILRQLDIDPASFK